jgi:hypothetical protein
MEIIKVIATSNGKLKKEHTKVRVEPSIFFRLHN